MLTIEDPQVLAATLEPWPALETLDFVRIRAGLPQHSGLHLMGDADSPTQAGIWECTPGVFDYTFPDHELCKIVRGEVLLTDPQGRSQRLGPGGILITRRGDMLRWDIRQTVRKVFLTW
jgi:hypothetical protein